LKLFLELLRQVYKKHNLSHRVAGTI